MATTTYRFVGEAPEVFPDYSSAFVVAGRQDDPNAPDFQQAGELRPGQEFEGPPGVVHVHIERRNRAKRWVPTLDTDDPAEFEIEPVPSDVTTTEPEA